MLSWILAGLISGAFLGTPCNSWSPARRAPLWSSFPRRLRTRETFFGIDGLSPADQHTLRIGNGTSARAVRIIQLCNQYGIPVAEENPNASLLWLTPARKRLYGQKNAVTSTFDMCAFGTPWKKRTRICSLNWQLALENKTCSGQSTCKFSNRKHIPLSGTEGGKFITQQGAVYPPRLCNFLARSFVSRTQRKQASDLWNLMK